MHSYISLGAALEDDQLQVLLRDSERTLCRLQSIDESGAPRSVLALWLTAEHPLAAAVHRLAHEFGLKDHLESAWAVRPLDLVHERDRPMLVLEDPGGELLDRHLGEPMDTVRFLTLAIGIAEALAHVHESGLIHKDLKPAHILADDSSGQVRLTGFGLASRLPRERQLPGPPEFIAGTLAYMAPEQTGRMNRSIDSRSDLYAIGVIFYQMLTGALPFTASDPMEWIHCHIARTAIPPDERAPNVQPAIARLVMKLLAKTAEDRYQTAAGVERDLRRCLTEWRAIGRISAFLPGETDAAGRLSIPEKLYGRTREVETLLSAFDRVNSGGKPEFVLVSGYSGIGKSAVVHELHTALVPARGYFASGKFDQYNRDIPYATLAQAFRSLIRPLLGKSEAELAGWRQAFADALAPNGLLIANLIPELKLIIGEQPPIPDLPPQDAQVRFQAALRRFIAVFAQPEHPLVLFLDDLQWLDLATLDLLEDLLRQPDVRRLMLIGAYRDNEVNSHHPLTRKLEAIRKEGAIIQEIVLAPLNRDELGMLIADALHCTTEHATPLVGLVHGKTGGNPFFAIQFVSALVDDALLTFNHSEGLWRWDLGLIQARGYTDNVVDLMVGKLNRLPIWTQEILKEFACLGAHAGFATLTTVRATSEERVHSDLWEALRSDFIVRLDNSYKFVHDRIQEAAYSLIPETSRAGVHLRIGRLLARRTPPEKRAEAVFEIVNQLNRGAALIETREEREQLTEFNLIAAKRARASTAYASALNYLVSGEALLASDRWERRHDLAFNIDFYRAECEFLTGELVAAEQRLAMLASHAANTVERATVESLRIDLYTVLDQTDRAVAACLDYLRHVGGEWSLHPTDEEAQREYDRIWSQLGSRPIEKLIELPLMSDPESLATLDVLTKILPTAMFVDPNLLSMTVCRAVNLSLERGNSDASCVAYVYFGNIAGPRFGNYKAGFRFGQLGHDLVEKGGLVRFEARTFLWFAQYVLPWTEHVKVCRELMRRAFDAAIKVGDLNLAVYSLDNLNTNFLAAGDPLIEAQSQAENGLEFARKTQFGHQIDIHATQLALIRTLRGLTYKFGSFDDRQFSEAVVEQHFTPHPAVYWIRKLQARFFAGDYPSALDAAARAQPKLWTLAAFFEAAEYHFYAGLSRAASCASSTSNHGRTVFSRPEEAVRGYSRPTEYRQHFEALTAHYKQLEVWAQNCPDNFENRTALLGAEIARLEGRELNAERLYEQSIHSARANGFVQNEAIAYEFAARFYAARGLEEIARLYLRNARNGYRRWGADGKARQLEEMYPQLGKEAPLASPTSTIEAPVDHLDLATVIKVSQSVSREIVPERLIDTIMRVAIEQAGAQRGVLIVSRCNELWCVAEGLTRDNTLAVELRDDPVGGMGLPHSVIQYALRTREAVILDDAASEPLFAADPYIYERHAKSILCLPLLMHANLSGLLYLENNLAPRVFVQRRTAVLKLLASQAAISLENTRLYTELEEREARIRRLVDANIMGIFIWNREGEIVEANEAFLQMIGYRREDLGAGRVRWTDLTPPEWRESDERTMAELTATGTKQPSEKEFYHRKGGRVPVLVGSAAFGGPRDEGVAFVVDLTDRKRAEAQARETEQRYRIVQLELEHANRVATVGQLSASIAHEVNQPIAAAVTNAHSALRWLDARPQNPEKIRQALERIVANGIRASEVIDRIRALIKKEPPRSDRFEINEAIREIIALTHGETTKNEVLVRTHFADRLPLVQGDRVQLQQVLLNLIVNAIEAMAGVSAESRELSISTRDADLEGVLVAIADSGPGLGEAHLEQLFAAFHTTKPGGLGMGLVISRSIVETLGGRLWATGNAPRGAVFQFTIPTQADTSPAE
jgi:PAS domain S-box-containing protein